MPRFETAVSKWQFSKHLASRPQTTGVQTAAIQKSLVQTSNVLMAVVQNSRVQTADVQISRVQAADVQTSRVETAAPQETMFKCLALKRRCPAPNTCLFFQNRQNSNLITIMELK